jgi:glycosyltransferase involved in cell wall biosynthesis
MDKKRVVLVRTNLVDRDPWLEKEIDTLQRGGYAVTLICWDREKRESSVQLPPVSGYEEKRLRLKAPWGMGVFFVLPVWWVHEFFTILGTKCDIVQAIDLDSIMPAEVAARLKGKPVIYQIYDIYVDRRAAPKAIRSIAIFFEKLFMRCATAVQLSNETQVKEVNGVPNKNVVAIYNPAPDYLKGKNPPRNEKFTILYAGVLYRSRGLNIDKVFQAIKDMDGVKLVIAGYGDMHEEIRQWVNDADGKAEFLGRLTYQQVLEQTIASDLLFGLYTVSTPTVKYAASANKLMEAMMAKKPILVTKDTAMADLVKQEDFGIAVDPENVAEIRQAILTLKNDTALYRRYAENARRAYERTYNREVMEKRLLGLYDKILANSGKV